MPEDKDDRTVIRPGVGARTGTIASAPAPVAEGSGDGHGLSVGMRLGEFELTQRIGEGGFSIVYLAWDHSLERKVALKEYMPLSIATRNGNTQVIPRSERHRGTFEAGLRSFVNEAKLLAQFDHPSLVKVYRFWEAHGTAYMVMPFYEGKTVRDTVRAMPAAPDEAWIVALLQPLAQALAVIHAQHCYHRDIAPDNVILLAETGRPLLLDFGAARRVIGDMTQAMTVILKPGYAPIEQYDEVPGMKQGPWTDVYALAAVVHWLITGKTPPPSVGRMLNDSYAPLIQVAAGRYSAPFLQAIDRGLAVLPAERTQSVADLLAQLQGAPAAVPLATPAADLDVTIIQHSKAPPAVRPTALLTPAVRPTHAPAPTAKPRGGNGLHIAVAVAVIGAGLVAASLWWIGRPPPAPAPSAVQLPAPVSTPPSLPVVVPERAPPPTAIADPATEASPAPAPQVTAAPAAPPRGSTAAASPPPRAEVRKADRPAATMDSPGNAAKTAECARLLQRFSLGESNAELIQRVKTLGC